jgi:hypothetical protein
MELPAVNHTIQLLHDPRVREMADRNHQPSEVTIRNSYGIATCQVVCEQDGEEWPCSLRGQIDAARQTALQEALDSVVQKKGKP